MIYLISCKIPNNFFVKSVRVADVSFDVLALDKLLSNLLEIPTRLTRYSFTHSVIRDEINHQGRFIETQ